MTHQDEEVHCPGCGGTDMRYLRLSISDVGIECRNCGLGLLGSELSRWKDKWKELPVIQPSQPWWGRIIGGKMREKILVGGVDK